MQKSRLALVLDINEVGTIRDKKFDNITVNLDEFSKSGILVKIGNEPFNIPELNIKVAIDVKKAESDIAIACKDICEYIRDIINSVNSIDEVKVLYRGVISALKEAERTLRIHPYSGPFTVFKLDDELHQSYVNRCREIIEKRG